MINRQKTETKPSQFQKQPIEELYKRLWKLRAVPSPNKLLKFNYKQSVHKMQEKSKSSLKKMTQQTDN
jgi:hypothetical protein